MHSKKLVQIHGDRGSFQETPTETAYHNTGIDYDLNAVKHLIFLKSSGPVVLTGGNVKSINEGSSDLDIQG